MNFRKSANIIGIVSFLSTALTANVNAQEPTPCPPGEARVGQKMLYKPMSPDGGPGFVWVGGTCVSKASSFKGAAFDLIPTYELLTIIYVPPGNQSEVKYGSGSSIGSKSETKNTFKEGLVIHAETSFTETDIEALQGATSGSALELKKEQATTFSLNSQTDTASPDEDMFFIWINPKVEVYQTSPTTLTTVYTTPDGQPVTVVPVSAGELRDPSKMPAYKRAQLANLTAADRSNILTLDPRVSGKSLDPKRFVKINSSLQLDGPDQPGGSIPGEGVAVSNETVNTNISGTTADLSVSFLVGGEVSWGVVSKFMAGVKIENDYEATNEASTGTKQEAELMLKTSTVAYHDVVDVYFDTLFNCFAFVSQNDRHLALTKMLTGVVHDPTGKPLANKRVLIRLPDGSRRTLFTDSQGKYVAYNLGTGNVEVTVEGQKIAVPVDASVPKKLNIQLTKR